MQFDQKRREFITLLGGAASLVLRVTIRRSAAAADPCSPIARTAKSASSRQRLGSNFA
jgi:hypothetical protein